ncbi:lamin tail domain-containing protein [Candidatus Woesearchaeota archaeon]|nr:lamin tail domain-containing protein [Candidatus Woesearchaeota archaeon]
MKLTVLAIALILAAVPIAAQELTEIMYDPDGADAGREWMEIQNTGPVPVDIETWYFYENGVFHGITAVAGPPTLETNDVTVLASDPAAFMGDHPSYSGSLARASFSLSNTGEEIALADSAKTVVDSVLYTPIAPSGVSIVRIDDRFEPGSVGGTPGVHGETVPAAAPVPEFSTLGALMVLLASVVFVRRRARAR